MKSLLLVLSLIVSFSTSRSTAATIELSADMVQDKIRGGLLGQILGDLNGLAHEMKYIAEPGNVSDYVPALPQGAWTDDDTDFEWVYVVAMQQRGITMIPARDIPALWQAHINRAFWCANQYARRLMDLGIQPPLTGSIIFNPWSDFNIAGQFCSESWGLIAPGMPQTAGRIGLNYTRVAIDGEPAQCTQLFDAMIATAFLTNDLQCILDAGAAALDKRSMLRQVLDNVRAWHRQHPDDWRATRRLVKEKYSRYNGAMRDKNGFELNTASVIGALLYGQGDFVPTATAAFNFGWDADCNAATAGTVVGVLKGWRWMMAQGWDIKDVYRNTTRDHMPTNETITSFGDRLIALAERVIEENDGRKITRGDRQYYEVVAEPSANVLPLSDPDAQFKELRTAMSAEIEEGIVHGQTPQQQARAAYQAICLDLAQQLRGNYPEPWAKAITALESFPKLLAGLFNDSPTPAGDKLRARAIAAGLNSPETKSR